jgi:Leucine-rich repeat (LRR) protein
MGESSNLVKVLQLSILLSLLCTILTEKSALQTSKNDYSEQMKNCNKWFSAWYDIGVSCWLDSQPYESISTWVPKTIKRLDLYNWRRNLTAQDIDGLLLLEELTISLGWYYRHKFYIQRNSFGKLDNLKFLELKYFNLQNFPEKIFRSMPKLEKLKLHSCKLTELPDVQLLPELKELDVSENHLASVKLQNMPQVITLDVSYNYRSNTIQLQSFSRLTKLDINVKLEKLKRYSRNLT